MKQPSITSVTLADLCIRITDGKHGDCKDEPGSGFFFISAKDVRDGKIAYENAREITGSDFEDTHRRTQLEPDDILITNSGTIGRIALVSADQRTFKTTFQKSVAILKPQRSVVDARFLYYLLIGEIARLKEYAGGTAQKNLLLRDLRDFGLQIPNRDIQLVVAGILTAYDDLIDNNTRRIAILEEMARRIFEEWFVHFRAPGCEGLALVDSAIGPVPRGWTVAPMESVCSRITDGAHKSPTTCLDGVPMASVKDMTETDFNVANCRLISEADYADLVRNDCKPLLGDILIAKDGSYLKHVFLVRKERDLAILSSIAILRPNGRLRPNLMVQCIKHPTVISRMKGYVSGVAIPRIVLRDFRQFLLVIPPSHIQEKCEAALAPVMQLSWQLGRINVNLRAQRDLLLPKLISSEIDISATSTSLKEAAE
jgi:type I restriction enzyme S subunit